jgi:hypothetical protein
LPCASASVHRTDAGDGSVRRRVRRSTGRRGGSHCPHRGVRSDAAPACRVWAAASMGGTPHSGALGRATEPYRSSRRSVDWGARPPRRAAGGRHGLGAMLATGLARIAVRGADQGGGRRLIASTGLLPRAAMWGAVGPNTCCLPMRAQHHCRCRSGQWGAIPIIGCPEGMGSAGRRCAASRFSTRRPCAC